MTSEQYQLLRRLFGGLSAVAIAVISAFFSQDGFNISVPGMGWVGWILALTLIPIEIVWNHERHRSGMLWIAGAAAYIYGIVTNAVGIMNLQGFSELPWDKPWLFIIPAVIGFFVEWVPEPLLNVVLVDEDQEIDDILRLNIRRRQPAPRTGQPQPVSVQGLQEQMPPMVAPNPPVYFPKNTRR